MLLPMIGVSILAAMTENHIMAIIRHINHFRRFILYALTSLNPAKPMNMGIMKAESPKHLDMKKYETNAPKEPQLFLNSLFLLSIS